MHHRRNDIDGIRAIAIISVVLFHAWPNRLIGGFTGVDVFFVISGFLISNKISYQIEHNTFSLKGFFLGRFKRLAPPLAIVIFAFLISGYFLLVVSDFQSMTKQIQSGILFTANFHFYSESGYFDMSNTLKPFLHLWSLSVEEQFYFFWPLLLLALSKYKFNPYYFTLIA